MILLLHRCVLLNTYIFTWTFSSWGGQGLVKIDIFDKRAVVLKQRDSRLWSAQIVST